MLKVHKMMILISRNLDTVMVFNTGLMVPTTKVSGSLTKRKAKVLFGMLKAMFTEVNLRMIWQMDMVSILISTVQNTKANLKMMFKKAMVKKNGSMALSM